MTNKTHYRKVFKSDHLGVADLEDLIESGSDLTFTIKHVNQEIGVKVAGRKMDGNIAYFEQPIKPLVLNATNSKIVKKFAGGSPFVEDWKGLKIKLYIDENASFGGEKTGGVRINPNAPQRMEITPDHKMWQNAINAYVRDGDFNSILARADLSEANQKLIIQECTNA